MLYNKVEVCEICKNEKSAYRPFRYPILLQSLFGLSFIMFIFLSDKYHIPKWGFAIWTSIQIVLGLLLFRARIRARTIVYRCNRCQPPLR